MVKLKMAGLLGTRFGLLGALLGRFPLHSIAATITLTAALLSIPPLLFGFAPEWRLGLDSGFVPATAPSRQELRAQREFFNASGDAWYMALFARTTPPKATTATSSPSSSSTSAASMLDEARFNEFDAFYADIIAGNNSYSQMCAPLCELNDQMRKLMENRWLLWEGVRWPVTSVFGYSVNIGKHLFNRRLNSNGEVVSADLLAYYLTAFVPSGGGSGGEGEKRRQLDSFEADVVRRVEDYNNRKRREISTNGSTSINSSNNGGSGGGGIEIIAHGSHVVGVEIQRGIVETFRTWAMGHALAVTAYIFLLHLSVSRAFHPPPQLTTTFSSNYLSSTAASIGKTFLLAVLTPVITVASLLSASTICVAGAGLPISLLHITSPTLTLLLVLGTHSSFQLTDTWCRLRGEARRKRYTRAEYLAAAFDALAPHAFLAGLGSLSAAFLLAAALLYGSYAGYSLFLGVALLLQLVYHVFLYAPTLAMLAYSATEAGTMQNTANTSENGVAMNGNGVMSSNKNSSSKNGLLLPYETTEKSTMLACSNGIGGGDSPKSQQGTGKIPIIVVTSEGVCSSSDGRSHPPSGGRMKGRQRQRQRLPNHSQVNGAVQQLFRLYANFLRGSLWAKLLLLAGLVSTVYLAWRGCAVENRMDYRRMLPGGSPAARGFDLMDTIWMDWLQIVYIVERAPDFEDASEYAEFRNFITDATSLPNAYPPSAHMSWLFDYYDNQLGESFFLSKKPIVNMTAFPTFISEFPYSAWQNGAHYTISTDPILNTTTSRINSMLVIVAYNATRGLNGKHRLLRACREVTTRYPRFRIQSFDADSQTVDIIDNLPAVGAKWVAALVAGVAVVYQLVLCDVAVTIVAAGATAALVGAFFGLGSLVGGLALDPLTLTSTMCVAAATVQLGTSLLGDYLTNWAKDERLRRSLQATTGPLIKTSLIWFLAFAPQLFTASVEFFVMQARLSLIGVCIALGSSLFLLPTTTVILPGGCLSRK